ncbi:MAG: methyl-accepting chemotaxis protein [Planctomycetota bacterium]
MSTQWKLLLLHVASAVSGIIGTVALGMGSTVLTALLLVAAVAGIAMSAGFTVFKAGICRRALENSLTTGQPVGATGITEVDGLVQRITATLTSSAELAERNKREMADLADLISDFDRRSGRGGDEEIEKSIANQISGLMSGYGNSLSRELRQLMTCSREMEGSTEELVAGAEVQAETVSQTASLIEKLSTHIDVVRQNADEAVSCVQTATSSTDQSNRMLQQLSDDLTELRNVFARREKRLAALGHQTTEIESIVEAIGGLSARTDLLALNASIESVRAGENGRGFALVADEVRSLAEQSSIAASEIATRIKAVRKETQFSIDNSVSEHSQMQDVLSRFEVARQVLVEVQRSTGQSSRHVEEMSRSSRQQLKNVQDVVQMLARFSDATNGNRSNAEGMRWKARTLQNLGDQLGQTVSTFMFRSEKNASRRSARSEPRSAESSTSTNSKPGGVYSNSTSSEYTSTALQTSDA